MTPGQARTALLSFLLVTAGVAINALFLQAGPLPAGKTVADRPSARPPAERGVRVGEAASPRRGGEPTSSPQEQALRIARFAADPGKIDPAPAGPDDTADVETIRAIQRELKVRGYGPVAGDGAMGLGTRAAIMAFEHDHGMALSGQASERLLKRIVLGAADPAGADGSGPGGAGTTKLQSGHAEQVIRAVQQWLAALGYQPGRIDGRPGEDTVKAIRDFEMDKGLVPRGRVSAELVARLSEAAAPKSPAR
jgi:peptidoglycan hydrolase-like protein with peptidoglycan-binding domain